MCQQNDHAFKACHWLEPRDLALGVVTWEYTHSLVKVGTSLFIYLLTVLSTDSYIYLSYILWLSMYTLCFWAVTACMEDHN